MNQAICEDKSSHRFRLTPASLEATAGYIQLCHQCLDERFVEAVDTTGNGSPQKTYTSIDPR